MNRNTDKSRLTGAGRSKLTPKSTSGVGLFRIPSTHVKQRQDNRNNVSYNNKNKEFAMSATEKSWRSWASSQFYAFAGPHKKFQWKQPRWLISPVRIICPGYRLHMHRSLIWINNHNITRIIEPSQTYYLIIRVAHSFRGHNAEQWH